MKYLRLACVLALALGVVVPVSAQDVEVDLTGQVRGRWEYVQNIFDGDDDNKADNLDFWPYRVRFGADVKFSEGVSAVFDMQAYGFFGDTANPNVTYPHVIGQSFVTNNRGEVQLYQGYLQLDEIGGSRWTVRLGRQEHTLGNELQMGDQDFYNGLSFDGLRGMAEYDTWNLNLFYYNIDEITPSTAPVAEPFQNNMDFMGVTVNFDVGLGSIEPYLLKLRRNADNVGAGSFDIYTLGAQWGRAIESTDDAEDSPFEYNVEAAYQTGDAGTGAAEIDVKGYIVEAWFGYNFAHSSGSRSRVHLGVLAASGNDTTDATEFSGYVPLFTDVHAHNRLGNIDLFGGPSVANGNTAVNPITGLFNAGPTNIMDINLGYHYISERNTYGIILHNLTLAEEAIGVGPGGSNEDAIGNEIDLIWQHNYSDHVNFEIGVGQLMAGDLLDAAFGGADGSADDVVRAWWQLDLRF